MSTELEAQAEEQTACVEGIESSQEEFKRKDNYRSIRVGLNSFFKIVSMDGILSSSQGMMSHWVLTPPLTCPNGCTRNPELHNIQALSMSTGSPLNLNVHYFGKRAYFISQVQKKKSLLLKPEHNKVNKKYTSSMMLIYFLYSPEGMQFKM